MTVFAFSGSPRSGSIVGRLLQAAGATAPARFFSYKGLLEWSLFNPDLDGPGAVPPPPVAALRRQLQTANAVLIATPECVYGMPGSLKNALGWLVSASSFCGGPTGVLSASPSELGGEKARASLLLTLVAFGAAVAALVAAVPAA